MDLHKKWEDLLAATWGNMAWKWYERSVRKRHTYGNYFIIPPGYEFHGWVVKKPGSSGFCDPLDQISTVGYNLYPADKEKSHEITVCG